MRRKNDPPIPHRNAVDATMPYQDCARHVGIIEDGEAWSYGKHIGLISKVLCATGAVADQCGETIPAHRIVDATTGKPGKGNFNRAHIVIERAEDDQ